MEKAILDYKESGNGYVVRIGENLETFETYSGAYKHTKSLLEHKHIGSFEDFVFPEHSIM